MDFTTYQRLAMRTAKPGAVDFNLMHAALGVTGEAGEFADAIKKHLVYGRPLDLANAREELGDILWFVALACDALQVDMGQIAQDNIEKLRARYPSHYSDQLAVTRLDKHDA